MLNLEEIRSFVSVARCGGFRRAADMLGCTQSTVSHHVAQLEKQAGCALFVRTTRSVRLTHEGEQLLGEAQHLLEVEAGLRERVTGTRLRGRIRMGASEEIASTRLPSLLARFAQANPGVSIEVRVGTSAELIEACHQGGMDVALVKRPPGTDHGQALWNEPLVWAAAERFMVSQSTPLPLALYQQEESISRRATLDALRATSRAFRIAYASYSLAGIRAAVMAGLAIAALPESALGPGLRLLGAESGLPPLPPLTYIAIRRRKRSADLATDRLYKMLCSFGHAPMQS